MNIKIGDMIGDIFNPIIINETVSDFSICVKTKDNINFEQIWYYGFFDNNKIKKPFLNIRPAIVYETKKSCINVE